MALNSGMVVRAGHRARSRMSMRTASRSAPMCTKLRKFVGLNERTCLNQKPIVKSGDKVEKGQVIADGAATYHGELAFGRNVLVGVHVRGTATTSKTRSSSAKSW